MNDHSKATKDVLDGARKEFYKSVLTIEEKATEELQKLYKGKHVLFECYDALTDGDSYHFDQEILDIKAYKSYGSSEFNITVTTMFKSMFAPEDAEPKPCTFYLYEIKEVRSLPQEQVGEEA